MVLLGHAIAGVIFLLIGSIFLKYKLMQRFVATFVRVIANFRIVKLYPQKLRETVIRLVNAGAVFFAILFILYGILLIIVSLL